MLSKCSLVNKPLKNSRAKQFKPTERILVCWVVPLPTSLLRRSNARHGTDWCDAVHRQRKRQVGYVVAESRWPSWRLASLRVVPRTSDYCQPPTTHHLHSWRRDRRRKKGVEADTSRWCGAPPHLCRCANRDHCWCCTTIPRHHDREQTLVSSATDSQISRAP